MSYASTILAEANLVSYWRLAESSGTAAADSKGSNTGTYTGGFTLGTPGPTGGGVTLDGSTGFINVASPSGLPTTGAYSLEFWCQFAPTANLSGSRGIVGYGNYGSNGQVDALKFSGPTSITNYWWGNDQAWSTPDVRDGRWHHVVATWDGATRRLYLDGDLLAGFAATGLNAAIANLNVGRTNATEYYPAGALADVAIYSAALSAAAVSAHWIAGVGAPVIDLPGKPPPVLRRPQLLRARQCVVVLACSDGGATVRDLLGRYHGTYQNPTATSFATGPAGRAIVTNGTNQYVALSSFGLGSGVGAVEWAGAILGTGTPDANGDCLVWGNVDSGETNGWGLFYRPSVAQFHFGVTALVGIATVFAPLMIKIGRPYHVLGTYDGTTQRIYINGSLVGSMARGTSGASGSWNLGFRPGTISSFANVRTDWAAAYAKDLQGEAARLAADPFAPIRSPSRLPILASIVPSFRPYWSRPAANIGVT